ncbi:MAG: hypothetical protein COA79_15870 [Planctomycetota bacterium]|nr:MAG: hypothetical protein COA79_15870 [Planctomycetota bacterium]
MSDKKTFIENWLLEPYDLISVFENCSDSNEPFVISIHDLHRSKSSDIDYLSSESRAAANNLLTKNIPVDENLFSFFLLFWAQIATGCGYYMESEKLVDRFDQLNSKNLLPEIKALKYMTHGFLESSKGNRKTREENLIKALSIKNLNHIHRTFHWYLYIVFLGCHGRFQESLAHEEKLCVASTSPKVKLFKALSKLINSFVCCNDDSINKYLSEMKNNKLFHSNVYQRIYKKSLLKNFISIYENKYEIASFKNSLNTPKIDIKFYEIYIKSTHYLLNQNSLEALKWARKGAHEFPLSALSTGLFLYILIRAELANRNADAGLKLLSAKIDNGDSHYLDDFFFARIYLLMNEFDKAAKAFGRLQNSVKWYGAEGRLDFELDLACEISKSDLRRLLNDSQKHIHLKFSRSKKSPFVNTMKQSSSKGRSRLKGNSLEIEKVKDDVLKFASIDHIVLITGETGVGKEEVARAIHEESERSKEPFIAVNCGALVDSLLQSELFGHKAGAYTGAQKAHAGIFETAGSGTVFLDEIGEISPLLQVSLLRVLEYGHFKPIGSATEKKYHCRILLATNKDLKKLADEKSFRKDLYFRMNSLEINVPPLRERTSDILTLTNFFHENANNNGGPVSLSPDLMTALEEYDWPGNVRQLKNEVERMRMFNSENASYDLKDFSLKKEDNLVDIDEPQDIVIKTEIPKVDGADELKNNLLIDTSDYIIREEKTPLRRLEKIKELFIRHQKLTRGEIIKIFKISPGTATSDLQKLEKEQYIKRVCPTPSPRSHYFTINQ